jgi:hypothetical protein
MLELELHMQRARYVAGESILAVVLAKNLGSEPITLAGGAGVYPRFVAQSAAGTFVVDPAKSAVDEHALAPASAAGDYHDIGAKLAPGSYRVHAELDGARSTEVAFEVESPRLAAAAVGVNAIGDEAFEANAAAIHHGARFSAAMSFTFLAGHAGGIEHPIGHVVAEVSRAARCPQAVVRSGSLVFGDEPKWAVVWLEPGGVGAAPRSRATAPHVHPHAGADDATLVAAWDDDGAIAALLVGPARLDLVRFAPPRKGAAPSARVAWSAPLPFTVARAVAQVDPTTRTAHVLFVVAAETPNELAHVAINAAGPPPPPTRRTFAPRALRSDCMAIGAGRDGVFASAFAVDEEGKPLVVEWLVHSGEAFDLALDRPAPPSAAAVAYDSPNRAPRRAIVLADEGELFVHHPDGLLPSGHHKGALDLACVDGVAYVLAASGASFEAVALGAAPERV